MTDWETEVCGLAPLPEPPTVDATPGLVRMTALVDQAEAQGSETVIPIIAGLLVQPDALDELADAVRADRPAMDSLFMRLRAVKRLHNRGGQLKDRVDSLAVARTVAANKAYQQAVAEAGGADLVTTLRGTLGGHPIIAGLTDPPGWRCTPSGLFRVSTDPETGAEVLARVAHRPMLVEGRYRDIADGSIAVALGWPSATGGWSVHHVPRQKVADTHLIVTLAGADAPVLANNAKTVVAYMADAEAANASVLPEVSIATRMGWHHHGTTPIFLWGRHQITPDGVRMAPPIEEQAPATWSRDAVQLLAADPGVRGLASGFGSDGTWEGWASAYRLALPYPRVLLGIYAAVVPPLLIVLTGVQNFIFEYCGETSRGKTTSLRLAASVWGRPDEGEGGILRTWDATPVFIEGLTTLCNNLPLFVDDTRRARRQEDVPRVIYNFASGQSRGRGSITGFRPVASSRGVLLMTGEAPATSFSNQGGSRARVLSVWGSPFDGADAATQQATAAIVDAIAAHHGLLGPRVVQWMLREPAADLWLQDQYRLALKRWTGRAAGDPVAGRLAQAVAAMSVAKDLLEVWLGLPKPERDPLEDLWRAVCAGAREADRPAAALQDVVSWAAAQQQRLYAGIAGEADGRYGPNAGYIGARVGGEGWTSLALLPTEVQGFLKLHGYDVEATIKLWHERGWTARDGNHRTRQVMVGQVRQRCVVITRAGAEAAEKRLAEGVTGDDDLPGDTGEGAA